MNELFNGIWAMEADAFRIMKATIEDGLLQSSANTKGDLSKNPLTIDNLHEFEDRAPRFNHELVGKGTNITAVVPIYGVVIQKVHPILSTLGIAQAATDVLYAQIDSLIRDKDIDSIVLNINSPGGSVSGVFELAKLIHISQNKKPIVAISNSLAAGAAYWIGAAASKFLVTPSSETGGIGVFTSHIDISKYEKARGLRTTMISAGKYKVEGSPYSPLSDEAKVFTQKWVDEYYSMFIDDIEHYRNRVMSLRYTDAGPGRTVGARQAVNDRLADGTRDFPELLMALSNRSHYQRVHALAPVEKNDKETEQGAKMQAFNEAHTPEWRIENLERGLIFDKAQDRDRARLAELE